MYAIQFIPDVDFTKQCNNENYSRHPRDRQRETDTARERERDNISEVTAGISRPTYPPNTSGTKLSYLLITFVLGLVNDSVSKTANREIIINITKPKIIMKECI